MLAKTVEEALRPFVRRAEELEDAAEEVKDAFIARVRREIMDAVAKANLAWRPVTMEAQSFGFENRARAWNENQRGWSLGGTLHYPGRVEGHGRVTVSLLEAWAGALTDAARYFTAPSRGINLDTGALVPLIREAVAEEFTVPWDAERVENALWRSPDAIVDDSETTIYDDDGMEEETIEGLSARFDFRFDEIEKDPPTASLLDVVRYAATVALRVPLRVRVRIEGPE